MKFDYVHDIQNAYRKVLLSMAFAGDIVDLKPETKKIDLEVPFNPNFHLLSLMLLDPEVTFAVVSANPAGHADFISQMTYSRPVTVGEADFVFVLGPEEDASAALAEAREGTLIDPHRGATVLMEARSVSPRGNLILKGPGIEKEKTLGVDKPGSWLESRAEKNREYPLGIELFILDREGRLAALPRTTQIERRS